MISAVRTDILSSVSAYGINFLMISRSFVPVSSHELSIPRSLQFNTIIEQHLIFLLTPVFLLEVIKTGEAPVHCLLSHWWILLYSNSKRGWEINFHTHFFLRTINWFCYKNGADTRMTYDTMCQLLRHRICQQKREYDFYVRNDDHLKQPKPVFTMECTSWKRRWFWIPEMKCRPGSWLLFSMPVGSGRHL